MESMIKRLARWVLREEVTAHRIEMDTIRNRNRTLQAERDEMRPFTQESLRRRARMLIATNRLVYEAKLVMALTQGEDDPRGFGTVHPADRWGIPRNLFGT